MRYLPKHIILLAFHTSVFMLHISLTNDMCEIVQKKDLANNNMDYKCIKKT